MACMDISLAAVHRGPASGDTGADAVQRRSGILTTWTLDKYILLSTSLCSHTWVHYIRNQRSPPDQIPSPVDRKPESRSSAKFVSERMPHQNGLPDHLAAVMSTKLPPDRAGEKTLPQETTLPHHSTALAEAAAAEHALTPRQAVKTFRVAFAWCM